MLTAAQAIAQLEQEAAAYRKQLAETRGFGTAWRYERFAELYDALAEALPTGGCATCHGDNDAYYRANMDNCPDCWRDNQATGLSDAMQARLAKLGVKEARDD